VPVAKAASGPVRQVASSSSGYKWIAISEFRDFCEILAMGKKNRPAPGRYSARRATSLELTLGGKSVEATVRVISSPAVLRRRGLVWASGTFYALLRKHPKPNGFGLP
jgi:hypothetical protein